MLYIAINNSLGTLMELVNFIIPHFIFCGSCNYIRTLLKRFVGHDAICRLIKYSACEVENIYCT